MNKKGSILDTFFIPMMLLFVAISILFGFVIMSAIDTQIQAQTELPTIAKDSSTKLTSFYPGIIDNSMLIITIILCLGMVLLASLVRVHPIFIVFFIPLLFISVYASGVFSTIYQEMASNAVMIAQADQLVFTSLILNYLPKITGAFGVLLMVVMYKLRQEDLN